MDTARANPQRTGDDRVDTSQTLLDTSCGSIQSNRSSDARESGNENTNCFQPTMYQKKIHLPKCSVVGLWLEDKKKTTELKKMLRNILFCTGGF